MKLFKSAKIMFIYLIILELSACKTTQVVNYRAQVTEYKLIWQGRERTYLIHLPPKEKMQKQVPLLFHLHGGGGTSYGCMGLTFGRFNELADREGFIVVYPQGFEKQWNDGRTGNFRTEEQLKLDDVGFIVKITEELKKKYKIDNTKIFTAGMSNGGFMSSRLICDRPDIFNGAAIITATLSKEYFPKCNPSKPVAVLIMNGTDDPLVPYNGGFVKVFKKTRGEIISTDDLIQFWKEKNACTNKEVIKPKDKYDDGTSLIIEKYTVCKTGGSLLLYKIEGGGHTWPGGKQYLGEKLIGKTSKEINACDEIWNFFKTLK